MISITGYFDKMKNIQKHILGIFDMKPINKEDWNKLFRFLDSTKVDQDPNEFKSFLHMISIISENYLNSELIFPKMEKILLKYKETMSNYLSNNELFTIFKRNKRCILFLFQEKIISPNRYIISYMKKQKNNNYIKYFYNEIQELLINDTSLEIEEEYKQLSEINEQKRKIGENDNEICLFIRNDSINEFINFVNRHKIKLSSEIPFSNFETNSFLIKNTPTLIEYAAFFGSLQIFKHLYSQKVKFDQKIYLYAVHWGNFEIIHLIEKKIPKKETEINNIYFESLKCHHNNICRYFENNYEIIPRINRFLKSYNFKYFTIDFLNDPNIFYELCHYDYSFIVNILLKIKHPQIQLNPKQNVLFVSAKKCNVEILKSLLKSKDYNVNSKIVIKRKDSKEIIESTVLYTAIEKENEEIVPLLLNQESIDVNSIIVIKFIIDESFIIIKETPLFCAMKFNNTTITKMLLNHKKINVNIDQFWNVNDSCIMKTSPLTYAIKNNCPEFVRLLLNRNDVDTNKKFITSFKSKHFVQSSLKLSVLHIALDTNNLEIIKMLVDSNKININSPTILQLFDGKQAIEALGFIIISIILFCIANKYINNRYFFVILSILIIYICITNILVFIEFQY